MSKKNIFYGKVINGKIEAGEKYRMCLDFFEGKDIGTEIWDRNDKRTGPQNNSLHLLFKQISDEMVEKGIDFRAILDKEIYFAPTPFNIKDTWKKLQHAMYGKKSTTELKKTGEINEVYDRFNKILIERTQGEISLPPFPSVENMPQSLTKRKKES